MPQNPSTRLAAIVVAAGASSRFGSKNKLYAPINGVPIIENVLRTVSSCNFQQRLVVASHLDKKISAVAERYQFKVAINRAPENGMASSIANGANLIVENTVSGIAIFLGDLPYLRPETIELLAAEFIRLESSQIVRPLYSGQSGHPVIFPARFHSELKQISGDVGANTIIKQNLDILSSVATDDKGTVCDIDTESDIS